MMARRILAAVLLLSGCAASLTPPSIEPAAPPASLSFDLLGPDLDNALLAPPDLRADNGFFVASTAGLGAGERPGVLDVTTPPGGDLLGRRADLPLTAAPNLRWHWRLLPAPIGAMPSPSDENPIRLVIGFRGGFDGELQGAATPAFDHALTIVWSRDAWENGTADRKGPYGRFVAHAGPGDGTWWEETVDLADLHKRLWPEVAPDSVMISFVAAASHVTPEPSQAELADATLSP